MIQACHLVATRDLAILYQVETKRINEAVRRNPEKFPERFTWILNNNEETNLRSQFATSSLINNHGGKRYNYIVFIEQGVAMLATILKSKIATEVSIVIMDAFVAMRHYLLSNNIHKKIYYIESELHEQKEDIKLLKNTFESFKPKLNHIFYEGQIYDAYSLLLDIFESSKESIIIIDNYCDKNLLDILSKTKKKIKIYSKNMNEELIKKYQSQYDNVEIIKNSSFHDRFIIIDKKHLYHCRASFKELGKKCFGINKIEDNKILETLLNNIKEEIKLAN